MSTTAKTTQIVNVTMNGWVLGTVRQTPGGMWVGTLADGTRVPGRHETMAGAWQGVADAARVVTA